MGNEKTFLDKIQIIETSIEDIEDLMAEHIGTLAYPMDSYLEDRLFESVLYKIIYPIGSFITERNCKGEDNEPAIIQEDLYNPGTLCRSSEGAPDIQIYGAGQEEQGDEFGIY